MQKIAIIFVASLLCVWSLVLVKNTSWTMSTLKIQRKNEKDIGPKIALHEKDETAITGVSAVVMEEEEEGEGEEQEKKPKHMFDVMQEKLYKAAISTGKDDSTTTESNRNNTPNLRQERPTFTLEGWERGTGGLLDADRMILAELYTNANSVFEFGLGESTKIAAHVGVPRYAGVDSDAEWVTMARGLAHKDHFRFTFADIGKTAAFGHPTNKNLQKIAYNYQVQPLMAELEPFDVYLVDGRYRVACFCASLLHAMKNGGDMKKVIVAMHDFERTAYHSILDLVDVFQQPDKGVKGKLFAFKLKETITEEDILQMWEEYYTVQG